MMRLVLCLAVGLSASTAIAKEADAVRMPTCGMQEQINVSVNYNFKAKNFADAKKMFDEQNAKVAAFAKQQNVKKFELQNQNYNIYSQPLGYAPDGTPDSFTYQVTGSSQYMMDNADAAFKFAEFLTSQKIQVGLNSNIYKNGVCNQPID